jgi:hypothetical protein
MVMHRVQLINTYSNNPVVRVAHTQMNLNHSKKTHSWT